jgi:hypothetical protein
VIHEAVLILTDAAFKALKRTKGGHQELLSCNMVINNHEKGAQAFWWKGRPCNGHQEKQLNSLCKKVEPLECTEYVFLISTDTEEETSSFGCFHDHPFKVKVINTFEVSDGR